MIIIECAFCVFTNYFTRRLQCKKGHSTENVAVCFREIRSNDLQKVSLMFLKDESQIIQWSSGWLESLEGLLLATHVSATRLCGSQLLSHVTPPCQSPVTVLLRTPVTQMIFFNQVILLLGSSHFLISSSLNWVKAEVEMLLDGFSIKI